ncbi:hypothetical protein BSKO_08222 [Bryopsis sp. KO-2023]|nr:hypothetical protein BSKO_08222 [Bryopsis sp. KO-2023]
MGLEQVIPLQRSCFASVREGGWGGAEGPPASHLAPEFRPRKPRRQADLTRRVPRTALFRLFGWIVALLVGVNTLSCGFFVCMRQPKTLSALRAESTFVTSGDGGYLAEFFDRRSLGSGQGGQQAIPRIIHQTYKSRDFPKSVKPLVESWSRVNPGWEVRFYDDEACVELVRNEFPQYFDAYKALPKDVERSDFFRYMVILRYGGVYADIDTESIAPLDSVIRSGDRLVAGWEAEVATSEEAFNRHFVRKRQVLQWVFAAEPGHPALQEICHRVASNAFKVFSENTNRDTLERTGPGLWTDVVLKHALIPEARIRILPRIAFGVHPSGDDGLFVNSPGIVVQHHFLGSWKKAGGWHKGNLVTRSLRWLRGEKPATPDPIKELNTTFFPVSIPWEPPFVLMVNLKGHGEQPGHNSDVSADISAWGNWQAGMEPARSPRVVDAIVGSLGRQQDVIFIDVGADLGYFTMAAASLGHKVVAFEESARNLAAVRSSVRFNKFEHLVDVRTVHLGSRSEPPLCNTNKEPPAAPRMKNRAMGPQDLKQKELSVDREQYGDCAGHHRAFLDEQVGDETRIGAVRFGASKRVGWILEGGMQLLARHMPSVVAVEFLPKAMREDGYEDPVGLIWKLYELGYREIYQAGHVCDHRWVQLTKGMRVGAFFFSSMYQQLKQPTWCKLKPDEFDWLVENAQENVPENILFVHRGTPQIRPNSTQAVVAA